MADATAVPEFQVHIEGHFCEHHQPLIKIFEIKGSGLLVRAELVASFPEGEEANVMNDLQRYEIDMAGHDMPTEIIAGIMGSTPYRRSWTERSWATPVRPTSGSPSSRWATWQPRCSTPPASSPVPTCRGPANILPRTEIIHPSGGWFSF